MHYQRHIEPEGDDSLARLLRRIPKGASVLELGPATGYCSRYLHEALDCTVDAVELSAEMAEHARPWCRRLVVGNLEELDLEQVLVGQAYEIILCADVIEHLHDPWSLARKLSQRLTPGGRLLLSVPNVGYLGLLVDLLRGNFRYRDEGLLDRTHLRFFTFDSLRGRVGAPGNRPRRVGRRRIGVAPIRADRSLGEKNPRYPCRRRLAGCNPETRRVTSLIGQETCALSLSPAVELSKIGGSLRRPPFPGWRMPVAPAY